MTDADFGRAISSAESTAGQAAHKAAQNAAQQVHTEGCTASQAKPPARKKAPVLLGSAHARTCETGAWARQVGDEGLEPSPFSPENQRVCDQSGAKSGARIARAGLSGPDLATVIAAWPALPQAIKAGIVAMVRATK